ncbi:small GTP-binding protein [Capsaspora owczarzaki ATCC 30864]|nr:small GTP-binding protein [Capsaspora owczarzaki ATCC 30864]|eukprot:XP_004364823.2 small GTP-binding protein [Capsaspora owczarzaki ATCC 30864]
MCPALVRWLHVSPSARRQLQAPPRTDRPRRRAVAPSPPNPGHRASGDALKQIPMGGGAGGPASGSLTGGSMYTAEQHAEYLRAKYRRGVRAQRGNVVPHVLMRPSAGGPMLVVEEDGTAEATLSDVRRADAREREVQQSALAADAMMEVDETTLAFRKKLYIQQKRRSFIDFTRSEVTGGHGGDGAISFLRTITTDEGGPDGGNGGGGGNVVFMASDKYSSLAHVPRKIAGRAGGNGQGDQRFGATGDDLIVHVPPGTVISVETQPFASLPAQLAAAAKFESQATRVAAGSARSTLSANLRVLADLANFGDKYVAAVGGLGGFGNRHFRTPTEQAPEIATSGTAGSSALVVLELKTIADVGLVGWPNAGKSTFLGAVSNAHPEVAPYPFTTLNPFVGVVDFDDHHRMTVADIPGLVEGAHANRGLGHSFLRHVERSKVLLYIIDTAAQDGRDPLQDLIALQRELELFRVGLSNGRSRQTQREQQAQQQAQQQQPQAQQQPQSQQQQSSPLAPRVLIVANKMDLPSAAAHYPALQAYADEHGLPLIPMSAQSSLESVREVTHTLRSMVEAATREDEQQEALDAVAVARIREQEQVQREREQRRPWLRRKREQQEALGMGSAASPLPSPAFIPAVKVLPNPDVDAQTLEFMQSIGLAEGGNSEARTGRNSRKRRQEQKQLSAALASGPRQLTRNSVVD